MIFEKMETIAILKATGFSGSDVNRIFMTIAMTIGVVGGLAGLLFGFGLSSHRSDSIQYSSITNDKDVPNQLQYSNYLIGVIFSLITTYFAGFFPARKAGKVDPVDNNQGEIR